MDDYVEPIRAFIGAWKKGDKTYYVKRSDKMENYPGVWSLFSMQIPWEKFTELPQDRDLALDIMQTISNQRLGGLEVTNALWISGAESFRTELGKSVALHLYRVELIGEPKLNPYFYSEGAFLTADEFRSMDKMPCGTCVRMWSKHGINKGYWTEHLVKPEDY